MSAAQRELSMWKKEQNALLYSETNDLGYSWEMYLLWGSKWTIYGFSCTKRKNLFPGDSLSRLNKYLELLSHILDFHAT